MKVNSHRKAMSTEENSEHGNYTVFVPSFQFRVSSDVKPPISAQLTLGMHSHDIGYIRKRKREAPILLMDEKAESRPTAHRK